MIKMVRVVILLALSLFMISCSEGSNNSESGGSVSSSTPSSSVDNSGPNGSVSVGDIDLIQLSSEFKGVYALKKFEITPDEGSDNLVIPISSVSANAVLTVHVIVDMWEYQILSYQDVQGNYYVSFNMCEDCIATGSGVHRQVVYDASSSYFACASCFKVFNLSSLGNSAARKLDKCIPLEIPAEDYEIVKMRDVEIDLQAFPWMRDDLENPNVYGVPAAPLSTLLDKDAIVISYDTLVEANEIFDQWLIAGREKLGVELEPLLPLETNTQ